MPDLLIELFSEEIPARMQAKAAADLKRLVTDGLVEAGLTYASAGAFSTPRRLALSVEGMLGESPTTREERKGPRVDAPEKAIEGFLRGAGVSRDDLEVRDEKKGQVYFATIVKPGRPASEIIAEVLEKAIRNFPWPKSMRWGAGSLRWVRPLHSILCVVSDESGASIVPLDINGIEAGNTTEGHRFMGAGRFSVASFDDYATKLKANFVVLSAEERAEHIWHDATNMAFAQGLEVVEDKGLLAEVAGLVEWPVVLMGEIGAEFLDLPPEVLQTSMREHQKFFSVRDPKSGKIVRFVTVANRETADDGATILAGNNKVLSARLADAKFFWENDLRVAKEQKMEPWLESLSHVTFHNKLGSQKDRIDRIAALAREIAPVVGADADLAEQAARVAKADLSSEMVYEFPELQGLMGRYYAEAAGMPAEVAAACQDHYAPLGPSDDVPTAPVSVAVALADKLDTLTGFWAIDEKPTGSKDPFALRRAALGVIRLVLGNGVRVDLWQTFQRVFDQFLYQALFDEDVRVGPAAYKLYPILSWDVVDGIDDTFEQKWRASPILTYLVQDEEFNNPRDPFEIISSLIGASLKAGQDQMTDQEKQSYDLWDYKDYEGAWDEAQKWRGYRCDKCADDLLSFLHDRLKVHLKDQGIRHDVIDACLAMPGNDDLTLLVKRAEALAAFLKTDDGENLLQGFKRANNILTQAEEKDGVEYSYGADVKFADSDEERALFAALDGGEEQLAPAMKAEDFATAMTVMAGLRAPIDAFFEAVQVNADNDVLRRNRLNLLSRIRAICGSVADLTRIDG